MGSKKKNIKPQGPTSIQDKKEEERGKEKGKKERNDHGL